jgi:hypothetical protein
MPVDAIHVIPDHSFEDWIVRDKRGHKLGHYPTRESAELIRRAAGAKAARAPRRLPSRRTGQP